MPRTYNMDIAKDNIKYLIRSKSPVKPLFPTQKRKLPTLPPITGRVRYNTPLKMRKPNPYNVFLKANKEVLKNMSRSEISSAYRQTMGSDSFPNYEPYNLQSVDSDEDPVDRFRLDELASFGTARQVSNTALKINRLRWMTPRAIPRAMPV